MIRAILFLVGLIAATGSALSSFFYITTYWPYRDLFDENGRYFDAAFGVVHHDASFIWGWGAVISALIAAAAFASAFRRRKR